MPDVVPPVTDADADAAATAPDADPAVGSTRIGTDTDTPGIRIGTDCQIGLRLPCGDEVWSPATWHGMSIDTPADRKLVAEAIRGSADNLGLDPDNLLSRYAWLIKVWRTYTLTAVVHEPVVPIPLAGSDMWLDSDDAATPDKPDPAGSVPVDSG